MAARSLVLMVAAGLASPSLQFAPPSGPPVLLRGQHSHHCNNIPPPRIGARAGLTLRMCEPAGDGGDKSLGERAKEAVAAVGSALTNPIPVSPVAAVAGLLAGSLSITVAVFVAIFAITIGPVDEPTIAQQTQMEQQRSKIDEQTYLFHEILNDLSAAYVDDVEPNKLFETGMRAMLGSLDPYTEFENNKDAENLQIATFGRYGGVGLTIGADLKYEQGKGIVKDDSRVLVLGAMEGYAWDAGLRTGDHILTVGGESIKGVDLSKVTTMLRGEPGTTVDVGYVRDGSDQERHTLLSRRSIKIKDVPLAMMVGERSDGVGYMMLKGFAMDTGREVRNALAKLREQAPGGELKGLILDLRGNPGGLLTSAVDVAEIFLPEGSKIVSTKGRGGPNLEYVSSRRPALGPETKIVVLTSGGTASAAEIVSGAIQDHDRGIILGERTFGKGLVQQVARLPFDTSLKLTVAKYYTPSGRCIQSVEYKGGAMGGDEVADAGAEGGKRQFKFGESRFKARKYEENERKTFKTDKGRLVRDGGGIEPDVFLPADRLSELELALLEQNAFLEFTGEWAKTHPTDERLAWRDSKVVTDEMFDQFERFVEAKDIVVKTRFDTALDELKEAFKESKLVGLEEAATELKGKAKQELLARFPAEKESLSRKLEDALRARVEPDSVRLAHALRYDKSIARAVQITSAQQKGGEYESLLAAGREVRSPVEGVKIAEIK